ncbi:carbohydrate binding domain-containing protein [Sanguibacter sp. YZGR15]|uniref:non-reducing end alpha-L-arabinofuranosidase n=2 Tax=Sanguibacter suaedae TaxID=2795737 RepID=A0A934IBN1_9MICO|nr:carbohydrate binding domain-containing protein [Sanguibacter suaedae]
MTQIGLYALAATDGTGHTATFDYVAVQAAEGADVVPDAPFLLRATGDAPHVVLADDGSLGLAATRPARSVVLEASAAEGGAVLTDTASGRVLAVEADGRLVLAADGAPGTVLRLQDAGGGRLHLRHGDEHVGAVDGTLRLADAAAAARFTLAVPPQVGAGHTITIDADGPTTEVSDDLYGIFYEDINRAADGGLYAELVQNRSFEYSTADNASYTGLTSWEAVGRGGGTASPEVVTNAEMLNANNRYYLHLPVDGAPGAPAGVRNVGYNSGIALTEGAGYRFSVFARTDAGTTPLTVRLEDPSGNAVHGATTVDVVGDAWTRYEGTLTATATTADARLAVLAESTATLRLDMVSLFPVDTFEGRENGVRKDLAEMMEAMDPQFLRFPGGCVTNVGTFDAYGAPGYDRRRTYRWKETVGPVEERPTNYNFWGYNQSYGLGYFEYFQLAEDLGSTPLPVVSVGVNGCGGPPPLTDPDALDGWVQDTLDLIEFANGAPTTEWGAVRAEMGHPEPFGLRYIGLGNEEVQREFLDNYPLFSDAIKAAHPEIRIISNSGQTSAGAWFDELWDFAVEQDADLVDEHYYNSPEWFLANANRYDSYDREGPHVFIGEYASKGNTFYNALAEAAFMTGIERNSDVIDLASYAPFFANEDYVQWAPDAVWFDNVDAYGSANYHVQAMFAQNVGDVVVPSTVTQPTNAADDITGGVFLSTWLTSAAYDNVRVTSNDTGDVLFEDDFSDGAAAWNPTGGTWEVVDGEYVQASTTVEDARSTPAVDMSGWSSYTYEMDARKTGGAEGFLVGYGAQSPGSFSWWNLGGWGNTRSAIQQTTSGASVELAGSTTTVDTDRTYRVKVVVEGRTTRLYLDDVLVTEHTDTTVQQDLYQVVTRDDDTGDLVLKVVNASTSAITSPVSITGDVEVAAEAAVTEMTGELTAQNTMSDPDRVVPVERTFTGAGTEFVYEFPESSITILRLGTDAAQAPGNPPGEEPAPPSEAPTEAPAVDPPAAGGAGVPSVAAPAAGTGDGGAAVDPSARASTGSRGALAWTGSDVLLLLLLAGGLVAGGAVLVRRRGSGGRGDHGLAGLDD